MVIPKGKTIIIKENSVIPDELKGINIVLNEPLTLSLQSQFSDLVGGETSSSITAIAGIIRDATGFNVPTSFKQFGLQLWNKTDPISFSVIVELNMKTNAYTDVYIPASKLMKLPLPGEDRAGGLIFPGPTVFQALGLSSRSNAYSIKVGNLFFYPVVFQKVEPTFSIETDTNGYPIWIVLKIDIKTIYTATTNAISNLDNSSIKGYE